MLHVFESFHRKNSAPRARYGVAATTLELLQCQPPHELQGSLSLHLEERFEIPREVLRDVPTGVIVTSHKRPCSETQRPLVSKETRHSTIDSLQAMTHGTISLRQHRQGLPTCAVEQTRLERRKRLVQNKTHLCPRTKLNKYCEKCSMQRFPCREGCLSKHKYRVKTLPSTLTIVCIFGFANASPEDGPLQHARGVAGLSIGFTDYC